MKKTYHIAIGVAIALVVVLGFVVAHRAIAPSSQSSAEMRTYRGHGISFTYPNTYMLRERTVDDTHRYHYAVTLVEDTPAHRALLNGTMVGDGPTAITFDVFQNNLDKQSLVGFVLGNSNSNFTLSDGTYKDVIATKSRVPALSYTWDGLYRGDSVVFDHESRMNIVMASVTYNAPEDQIRADFKDILGSVVLDKAANE